MSGTESLGNSRGPANDQALEFVSQLINQVQPGGMVQKFVLLVETIDSDDRWFSAFTAPGQKRWDSMGMLDYAITCERNLSLDESEPIDDDDDRDD